jgi:cyclin-dependent kinase
LAFPSVANTLSRFQTDYQSRLDAVISDSSKTDVPHTETHVQDSLTLPTGGVTIGRYVNGLFSDVYKAMPREDHDLILPNKSIVALKLTNPSAMEPPHDSIREVRLLQRARHPFVVELLDHFHQAGGRLILVFPFLPYTLEDQLKRGNMQLPHQKLLLSQLMQGLEHIHSCGIIHRDIKPSNILLASPTGPAYIADFGIAWAADDPSAEPENEKIMDVGTTSYRPPELMFGNQWYNSSIDMWATGCVVAQVVSLGSQTLFDSGDLGSDLALIKSIFSTLGTPNMDTWPVS